MSDKREPTLGDVMFAIDKLRVDLMARMNPLQHRMDGLDDHLTMGLGHSDRVERRAQAVSEDNRLIGEQLISLTRLLRRLEGRMNDFENRLS